MTSEELLLDDAETIRKAIESSIQRWGAGRLAKALVSIEAQEDIYTLADYMTPDDLTLTPAQETVCKEAWANAHEVMWNRSMAARVNAQKEQK